MQTLRHDEPTPEDDLSSSDIRRGRARPGQTAHVTRTTPYLVGSKPSGLARFSSAVAWRARLILEPLGSTGGIDQRPSQRLSGDRRHRHAAELVRKEAWGFRTLVVGTSGKDILHSRHRPRPLTPAQIDTHPPIWPPR